MLSDKAAHHDNGHTYTGVQAVDYIAYSRASAQASILKEHLQGAW